MGDRSKELRLLMKQSRPGSNPPASSSSAIATTSTSIDQLSGKDKAKLLKLLREKNKSSIGDNKGPSGTPVDTPIISEKPVRKVLVSSMTSSTSVDSKISSNQSFDNQTKGTSSSSNSTNHASDLTSSSLPVGFFDNYDDDDINEASSSSSSQNISQSNDNMRSNGDILDHTANISNKGANIASTSSNNNNNNNNNEDSSTTKPSSSLPQGFFDDEPSSVKDTNDSNINTNTAKNSVLDEFFQDIDTIPVETEEGITEATKEEEQMLEMEDEGLQHAYETRIAALYMKTAKLKHNGEGSVEFDDQAINEALKEARGLIKHSIMGIGEQEDISDEEDEDERKEGHVNKAGDQKVSQINTIRKRGREELIDEDDEEEEEDADDDDEDSESGKGIDDYLDNIDWMSRTL